MTAREQLNVAAGVSLPIDFVTKTCAILAQRRKGKTYCASVLAEELVRLRLPWVALDPTGAWWGLRSSADGEHAGLPVVVLGGQHGDLPLDRYAGAAIADLVLDHPGWYVLDLSLLEGRAAEREFATAFGTRLHRRKMQPGMDFPLHLFIDEADMFVPQEKETRGDVLLLAAYQGIVRRGGLHGLGCTLISQRPALVNKNVLTQLDLLLLLRLVAGNDQDAVSKNYVSRFLDKPAAAEVMSSLASLPVGEGWFLEPGAEPPLAVRAKVRERRTFNSSATPRAGEQRVEPKVFADVDLEAIGAQMAEAVERALEDDPGELRRRIATERTKRNEVERNYADLAAWADQVENAKGDSLVDELLAVYTIAKARVGFSADLVDEARALEGVAARPVFSDEQVESVREIVREAADVDHALRQTIDRLSEAVAPLAPIADPPRPVAPPEPPAEVERIERVQSAAIVDRDRERLSRPTAPLPAPPSVTRAEENGALSTGARHLLATLAQHHPLRLTVGQLALLSKRKARGGAWNSAIKQLRDGGYIQETGGLVLLTDHGAALSGAAGRPLSPDEMVERWRDALPAAARDIFDRLVSIYPRGMTTDALAEATGRAARGGSWNSAIATLTRNGLASKDGDEIRATSEALGG